MPWPSLPAKEHARRRAAYDATMTDGAAARMLGIEFGTFVCWRRDAGLPAKTPSLRRWTVADKKRIARTFLLTGKADGVTVHTALDYVHEFRESFPEEIAVRNERTRVRVALESRLRFMIKKHGADAVRAALEAVA
jgi:hypothetical protein